MEKKDFLSFNLGPVYRDFLESFKRELIVSLASSGIIQESEIEIIEDFYNLDKETGYLLSRIDGARDEVVICLKNRMSQITFCLDPVTGAHDVSVNFYASREDRSEITEDPLCWWQKKTSEDLLDGQDFLEAATTWLTIGALTPWTRSNFSGRTDFQ